MRNVGASVAALVLLLVALAPTLLLGESLPPFSFILMGGSVLVAGALLRWAGGANTHTLGTTLVVIGVVLLTVGVALTALALASRGW